MDLQGEACSRRMDKYKARFMENGFSEKEGIDYEETFTLVSRYSSI